MSETENIYRELLSGAPQAPGYAFRGFAAPVGMRVRAFVDGATRLPGVMLHVPPGAIPLGLQIPRMKGAEVDIRQEGSLPNRFVVYEIRAAATAYSDVFIELASRLIDDVGRETSAQKAFGDVARRLSSWARFFDARSLEGLGRNGQLGLIGELICLEQLAAEVGLSCVIRRWHGPSGTTHDFRSPNGAIEVKLSTTSAPERFKISSERQLDESQLPKLVLCAITAQDNPAGGIGLPVLVDRIRLAVQGEAPAEGHDFEQRLLESGFSDKDRQRYDVRIGIRHIDFALVERDFPRIRPDELRAGVFAVSYEIPRSALAPFTVPVAVAGEILRGID